MATRTRFPLRLRRHLKPTEPLLVGRLTLHFDTGRGPTGHRGRPYLGIEVWCPFCKEIHRHGWLHFPPYRSDAVTHRAAHCDVGSPLWDAGYHIGLDPQAKEHNRTVIRQYEQALDRYEFCSSMESPA